MSGLQWDLRKIPCSMVNSGVQPDHYMSDFSTFNDVYEGHPVYEQLTNLAFDFLDGTINARYIFLIGNPGCGKSMFLVCLFRAMVKRMGGLMGAGGVFYYQFARLINEIIEDLEQTKSTRKSLMRKILPIKYLFVDDFSTHSQIHDPNKMENIVFREILFDRYEHNKCLIATCNFTKSQLKQMVKNTYGDYMVSRIFSSAIFIEFPKVDIRQQKIKK